jgi:hypothetical protein
LNQERERDCSLEGEADEQELQEREKKTVLSLLSREEKKVWIQKQGRKSMKGSEKRFNNYSQEIMETEEKKSRRDYIDRHICSRNVR